MANNDLEFQIIYKLDKAEKQLDTLIDQVNKKGRNGLSKAGSDLGSIFGRQLTLFAVRSIGIGSIVAVVKGAFDFALKGIQSSLANDKADSNLGFNIDSINKENQQKYAILNDGTKSIEEQAAALGYTTDQIYEETSASQSSTAATKGLEAAVQNLNKGLKDKQRALEDSLKAEKDELTNLEDLTNQRQDELDVVNQQLQAIKTSNDERLKEARIAAGYSALQNQKDQLALQESQLKIKISERLLSGGYIFDLQQQLKILNEQQNLNDSKLNVIDDQIKLTNDQTNIQQDQLEQEKTGLENSINALQLKTGLIKRSISKAENQYQIDTQPAQRQIEDLQEKINSIQLSFKGAGSTKKIKQSIIDDIAKQKLVKPQILNKDDYSKLATSLFGQFGGLVSKGEIVQSINDLTQTGITDVNQLTDVITRFGDVATNKAPTITFGSAINQLSEQFRTNQAALGETAGLTQEYSSNIIPAGIQAIENLRQKQKQNADSLTEQEKATLDLFAGTDKLTKDGLTPAQKAQTEYYGLLDITNNRQGIFKNQLDNGKLALDQTSAAMDKLAVTIGDKLVPAILHVIYGPDGKEGGGDGLLDFIALLTELTRKDNSGFSLTGGGLIGYFTRLADSIKTGTDELNRFFQLLNDIKDNKVPAQIIPPDLKKSLIDKFPALKGLPGFANGGNFTVPPGYPNDSYPLRVQSGERVQITPSNQTNTTNNNNTTYNMWGNNNYNQPTPTSLIYSS